MLPELTLTELLEQTAAGTPVPGGGSLSALAAAMGAALAQMVAGLTIGRPRHIDTEPAMQALNASAQRLRKDLLAAMDLDAGAYTAVMAARKLPQRKEQEKAKRNEAIQQAICEATRVPLSMAEMALEVMALAHTAIRQGNPNTLSDGAVGALLARAALQGGIYNVRINLQSIRDEDFRARLLEKAAELEGRAAELEAAIKTDINL
jgi:formiminotetrahydrofolate cyclodeaminase